MKTDFSPTYYATMEFLFAPACPDGRTLALDLARITVGLGVHLLACGGAALLRRLRRHVRVSEPRPAETLRGTPTPDDLILPWHRAPRTLLDNLRIGSRLADLEPTLDNSFVFRTGRTGRKRIVARNPGIKGWLRDNAPTVTYSTAMHYKKLATRLRQVCGLDSRIPLEWILSSPSSNDAPHIPPSLRRHCAEAKSRLDRLLSKHPKFTALTRAVDQKLGILRMVTVRRARPKKAHPPSTRKHTQMPDFSLMSQVRRNGLAATLGERRLGDFATAIRRVLAAPAPDPATRRLQQDLLSCLRTPVQSLTSARP